MSAVPQTLPSHDWPAPRAAGPVDADVAVPGSKSLTNRLLVLAALADGPSRVRRPLRSRDTELMAQCLRDLGVQVTDAGTDWLLTPAALQGGAALDTGLAGTVMRFLPPVAALATGPVHFDGDPRARLRPMRPVLDALRTLGVDLDDAGRGALPFSVHGRGTVPGGPVTLDASASSQFISGLLLAAAHFERGVVVLHDGKPVPSIPHVQMTVDLLRGCGVAVDDGEPDRWQVAPGPVAAFDIEVEPDLSTAAPFLAAALVTGGRVRVAGWPQSTTQAGDALREILAAMGADVTLDRAGLTVVGTGAVAGLDVDLHDVGELTPVVAAVAALAQSPSWLRGIAHLRGHESDRLAALATEINALGGDVTETDDGLRIRPQPLHGGLFGTYHDHRMAMAAAVLGLVVDGVVIQDVGTTAKTLPQFTERWSELLASR